MGRRKVEHRVTEDGTKVKYCSRCDKWLSFSYFSSNISSWDNLTGFCKKCSCTLTKEYETRNPGRLVAYNKKYIKNMSEDQRERRRRCNAEYIASLPLVVKQEKYRRYREARKNRYGVLLLINNAISERIRYSLQTQDITKGMIHWELLVGWTLQELYTYLGSLFTGEMSWKNYGSSCGQERWWEIDHKVPQTWFSFKSVYDIGFKECWNLSNLQPKWVDENRKKGNRYAD